MSEPLSSTEIEDVLSSIRRLVSDDLRPLQRPVPASPAPDLANKLILTPALRVVQENVPLPQPASAPYRLHLGIPAQEAPGGLEHVVASVGAAVDAQSLEWEAETGDVAPFVAEAPQDNDWQDSDIAAPFPEEPVLIVNDADDFLFAAASGDETALVQPDSAALMPGWAQQDAEPGNDPTIDDDDAPALAHGTIEPDPAWADAAEASVIASLAAEVPGDDPETPASSADYAEEPLLFDEEVLRELVRDILREELAGRMGERITRNIRKLVRAEIARSFATQEFE